jgi:phage repressor protein C with HTH and peptisase S24 domain
MSIQARCAVPVPSDDMSPRMLRNESVIFETDQEPRSGDDVVIVLSTGAYLIRDLIDMNERELEVHTYTPDTTTIIPRNTVAAVYPIVMRCFCSLDELLEQAGLPEARHE